MKRYLGPTILSDLNKKMVFVSGPRQVGKTTLARSLSIKSSDYLNWDVAADRERILKRQFNLDSELVIFDEIHKYKSWRNYLKGVYDSRDRHLKKILVTGSAMLDYYRRGGDSLQGRYFHLRLHPFSVAELGLNSVEEALQLFDLGGFPEPYLSASKREAQRWMIQYNELIFREEVMHLERVQDVGNLELLFHRLPELVGSPLSINSLREDLQLAHGTVSKWLLIFERLYVIFRIPPFVNSKLRSVKKEQKHYHWNWALVEDPAKRFENFVASHLLKWVDYQKDVEGEVFELTYFRDRDDHEVDFVILHKRKPVYFIECKLSNSTISKSLTYLKNKFPKVQALQLLWEPKKEFVSDNGIRVMSAVRFLKSLV